jgi:hypothetical protein
MKPIEIRLQRHVEGKTAHYTITKVWPGISNVSFVQRPFLTYRDARDWCKREWPGVPVIHH